MAITPIAPTFGSVNASGSSIIVNWSNASNISTGTTVLLSTDDTAFFEYGGASAGATTTTISSLNLHSNYWVELLTESANGESITTSAHEVTTPYIAPTLVVTAPYPATQGQSYTLDLSATYAPGTLQSDMIAGWKVNYGDGSGVQSYNQPAGVFTSPTSNGLATTDTIQVTAIDGNGYEISYPSQNVTFAAPDAEPGPTSNNGSVADGPIVVGGEAYFAVSYDGSSTHALTVTSSNPSVLEVLTPTVTMAGGGEVLVKALSYGGADLSVSDGLGNYGSSGYFGDLAPGVTVVNDNETEGAIYNSTNMPGFMFTLAGTTSVSDVTINYTTTGSTLPSSLMGNLSSGSVVVPAGQSSVFVPFTVADDGKIAPTRVAVVTLATLGDLYGVGDQIAIMNVANTDTPTVTINGQSNNAVIPLDPQGDNTKLTDIRLDTGQVDGQVLEWGLAWNPDDFLMWPTKNIGTPGTNDLASYTLGNLGAHYDPYDGIETFTGIGAPPTDIYGQCLQGSANWNTTELGFSITVFKAATAQAAAAISSPVSSATGTANGLVIFNAGSVLSTSDVVVGQRMNLTARWEGPGTPANNSAIIWQIGGKVVQGFSISADQSTGNKVPLANTTMTYVTGSGPSLNSISFIWWSAATASEQDAVSVSGSGSSETVRLTVASPLVKIDVKSGDTKGDDGQPLTVSGTSDTNKQAVWNKAPSNFVSSGIPATDQNPSAGMPAIAFIGYGKEPFSKTGGSFKWLQTVTSDAFEGSLPHLKKAGLDGGFPYSYPALSNGQYLPWEIIGSDFNNPISYVNSTSDTPSVFSQNAIFGRDFSAKMYLMYEPDGAGANDWVPLLVVGWTWTARADHHSVSNVLKAEKPQPPTDYPSWTSLVKIVKG